jgi:hypothetical protein
LTARRYTSGVQEPETAIFIVRAVRQAGGLRGVVERVRTGQKVRFEDEAAIGRVIGRLLDETTSGEEDPT